MPVFNNALAGAAGSGGAADYTIERSLRFEPNDTTYLNRTPSSAGSNTTWTFSTWMKKTGKDNHIFGAGAGNTPGRFALTFDNDDKISVFVVDNNNTVYLQNSAALFRDPSAWYHIVVVADTTNSTPADRLIIYVNGVRQTLSGGAMPSNQNTFVNTAAAHAIGRRSYTASDYFDGYLAETQLIDGQALAATDFGGFDADTGVWNPKKYSGSYGTNGFLLDYSDNSSNAALGFNAKVSGTRYSAFVTGFQSSYPPANMFDGSTSTYTLGANSGGIMTFTPGTAIPYAAASGGVEVYFHQTSQPDRVRINGGSWVNQTNQSTGGWQTVSTGDGSITKMEFQDQSTAEAVIYAIRVNGTILTDPSGANDWTVNNFQTTSFDAVGNSSHVGPGTLTNLAPGTYYNLFAVDSNNVSSDPGSGALVRFNFSALGLTAPATITFDSYEQGGGGWTTVSNNIYTDAGTVTSSSTSSGNTRSNTVNIPSGATYFELPGSYNSQYSLYSNGIHNLVWDGVSYVHIGPEEIDSFLDSPTNYEADSGNNGGNHCTLNPLTTIGGNSGTSNGTLTQGNLKLTNPASSTWSVETGTIGVTSGKWYYEVHPNNGVTGSLVGWADPQEINYNDAVGNTARSYGYYATGSARNSNSNSSFGDSYSDGDVIGCAIDIDNQKIYWSKNGVWQNSADLAAGTGSVYTIQDPVANGFVYTPAVSTYDANSTVDCNFGQRPFKYPPGGTGGPPSDYKSLCTQNLEPLIEDPSTAFETKLYDGDGQSASSTQAITGLKFSPDFVWIKARDVVAGHALYDTVRPITQRLSSSQQTVYNNEGLFESFDSNGFTVKGNGNNTNALNQPYAAWAWDGGNLLTNSSYNQSAIWSNNLTASSTGAYFATNAGAADAFDGDLNNSAQSEPNGSTMTFSPTGGITVNTSLRIYRGSDSTSNTVNVSVNGGSSTTFAREQWVNLNFTGTLTSLAVSSPSANPGLSAIEVDGKILIDAGIVPVGSQPNSAYNQSQKWTDFWSSTNGFEQNSQTFAFDLNETNVSASASYGDTQSLVLTTGVPYSQSVRAKTHYTSGTAYINGNSGSAVNVASGWITLATGSGTLNRVDFTSSSARAYVSAIEVDGKLLIDPTPSIPSTVRVNPTAKFSIVKYTAPGAGFFNVAHGLNATPGLIISKHTNRSSDWYVWHSAFTDDGDYISLNTTGAKSSATDFWSAAKPNSIAFGGKVDTSHISGDTDIAYCWAPVEGYSAFGSYEGTGTADGAFVYTGFTPRFILIKNMDNGSNRQWILIDSARNTFNQGSAEEVLFPNDNQIESRPDDGFGQFGTKDAVDILSNGFKLREPNTTGVWTQVNNTSQTYIWAAFASDPLKYARAF